MQTLTQFKDVAQQVTDNGYRVVPCVQGAKNPAVDDWTRYGYAPEDSGKYAGSSVGIITGWGLVAVDIDILDEAEAEQTRDLVLDFLGDTIYRIGRAPKSLLVYRAPAGLRKRFVNTQSGRIEVLALGQQFVAYGIHPGTREPYTWPGVLGGPLETSASSLPEIDADQISRMLALFGVESKGASDADIFDTNKQPVGVPLADVKSLIRYYNVDDRNAWLQVGMAMHHEYDGAEEALAIWDGWSRNSAKYKDEECRYIWERFGKNDRPQVTIRSVLKSAKAEQRARETAARDAEFSIHDFQIESCGHYRELTEQIAKGIAASSLPSAEKSVLYGKLKARYKELAGVTLDPQILRRVSGAKGDMYECTEMGNAQRFVHEYKDKLMYCPETERWYRWDGYKWNHVVRELVQRMAISTVQRIKQSASACDDEELRDTLTKWYRQSSRANMVDAMIRLAQADKAFMRLAETMDADRDYIGCENGMIHIPTGNLLAPDRNQRITLNTKVKYDVDADCPVFKQTVYEALSGDQELVDFLQRAVGYTLLGRPDIEEIMIIPEGRGANGKSTIFNAVVKSFGDYAKYSSSETFTASKGGAGGAPREDILRLMGSRFVYVTELEENGVLRESFVKSMTGGESMPARGLHSKTTIEVRPSWVAYMPTNHLPIIKGEEDGIWRRIVVLPFHRNFTCDPEIKQDPDRKNKVLAELPGILKWAVEGAVEYLRGGLRIPESLRQETKAYRDEMDLLSDWMAQCTVRGDSLSATNAELWASWERWSRSQGMDKMITSATALTRRLLRRGFRRTRGNTARGIVGLAIRNNFDEWADLL